MGLFRSPAPPPPPPSPADLAALAAAVDDAAPAAFADLFASGEPGLKPGGWAANPATLTRWLVAEEGDVRRAAARLADHAVWRRTLLPAGWTVDKERAIVAELAAGKTWMAAKADANGRPILLTASNRHLRAARDKDAMTLALVYAMDVAARMADEAAGGDGRVVSIVDARGVAFCHLDSSVAKLVVDVAQAHYPERALVTHVFGAPRAFAALVSWLLPFISPASRGKVGFVAGGAEAATWEGAAHVDVAAVPAELGGGGGPAVPVQVAARGVGLVRGTAVPAAPGVSAPYGVAAKAADGAAGKEEDAGVKVAVDATAGGVAAA